MERFRFGVSHMTDILITPTTLNLNLNQSTSNQKVSIEPTTFTLNFFTPIVVCEPRPYYMKDTSKKIKFPDKFVKQRSNENYCETDFLPMPFMTSVKENKDNFHRMDLENSRIHNKTNIDVVQPIQRKIGWEGKLL